MHTGFIHLHEGLAWLIAVSTLITLGFTLGLAPGRLSGESAKKRISNSLFAARSTHYLSLVTLFPAVYLALPYFSTSIWIYAKLSLWLALVGIQGGMGLKNIKKLKKIHGKASYSELGTVSRKARLYALIQFVLVSLLITLGYLHNYFI